ncbi:MAG: tripeptide aminopeptidase PepT [Bacteroidaceae bacterium]|nr:tripeptide aminopeptidase PepT [Bacteroidaceae bacterium]
MTRKLIITVTMLISALSAMARNSLSTKVSKEQMLERFLSYAKIESQSVDDPDMTSFPMTEGQKEIAKYIYEEVKAFWGKGVKVTLSDDYYVYVDIPSNIKKKVPSILFLAHMDVTPECNGQGIKPIVHNSYDGGDIKLPGGITLSPNDAKCSHLKDLVGKTIITSDGTTLLGADDKTGCSILVSMVEELINNPKFKHGRVMVCLSQNEDVGKAAFKYDPKVFGDKPDVVIDIDGASYNEISVANFTAIGQTYRFKGNKAHASNAKAEKYADALTAAAYFIGLVPPEMNPSAREGEEGYIHCYALTNSVDEQGKPIETEYVVRTRLRYFDKEEGAYQKQLMEDNLKKVQAAFPFVEAKKTDDKVQYENIAYTMPQYVPSLIQKAAAAHGLEVTTKSSRAGTTSAMMVAAFPEAMPGGSDFYSGQNAEHTCYEWCCIEEMVQLTDIVLQIVKDITNR